jgi:hypothetical protein
MSRFKKTCFVGLILLSLFLSLNVLVVAQDGDDGIGSKTFPLSVGAAVAPGELDAVGMLNGGSCTATLIANNMVLTAAHCVCPNNWKTAGCSTRATFTLDDVFPVNNPKTPVDESKTRQDITIGGNVRVHPEYEQRGWLREDFAVVTLDQPANQVAPTVQPILVAAAYNNPLPGDVLTLVGYGIRGKGCSQPAAGKQKLSLKVTGANFAGIKFTYDGKHVCPGDSGGPVLNTGGRVVGVASWGNSSDESTYRPTGFSYNWIFNLTSPAWSSLKWAPVEQAGINSHAPETWCPNGSFLVGFDLDGDRNLSPYDSPIIGEAQCATPQMSQPAKWGMCKWVKVEQAGINSHAERPAWCPNGSFLVGFDLDGPRNISDRDGPVIGQAQCCTLAGANQTQWGSSYWIEVGAVRSHNVGDPWCLDGAFLTQFELDQFDDKVRPDGYDAPIVGSAKCSRPR